MLRSARSSLKNCIGGSPPGTGFDKSSGRAATQVRLIVWCFDCPPQVEPDLAEMAARHRAETLVPDWRERLVCSRCESRQVSGTKKCP
jgi:hypothetical protein